MQFCPREATTGDKAVLLRVAALVEVSAIG
jgi:hypothetical protein